MRSILVFVCVITSIGAAHSQNAAIPWKSFGSGFGVASSATGRISVLVGQTSVGTFQQGATKIQAGFLPGIYTLPVTFGTQVSTGWNMVSVPLTVGDARKVSLFPTAISQAFTYRGGYVADSTMITGTGYWLRFPAPANVPVAGEALPVLAIPVTLGWNMIGSVSNPIATGAVVQSPPGVVISSYYWYSGGYTPVTTLEPGKGYWVRVNQNGTLLLQTPGPVPRRSEDENPLSEMHPLSIVDASGKSQILYYGKSDSLDARMFDMPPVPPAGVFDVRFAGGSMVALASRGEASMPVVLSSLSYPAEISWTGCSDVDVSLQINERVVSMKEQGSVRIDSIALVVLTQRVRTVDSDMPRELALDQNYPNPFNPTTTIRYAVPQPGQVRLTIFNILGERVATLVDEAQDAGYKSATWNASGVASGVYFCILRSAGGVLSRKLLLVK